MISLPFFLSILLSMTQLVVVVMFAPLIAGFRVFMSARLTGVAAPPVLRRWYLIATQWCADSPDQNSDPLTPQTSIVASCATTAAMTTVLVVSLLVPMAASGLATAHLSDIFVITLLLMSAQIACQLPALGGQAETATTAFRRLISASVAIPVLFLIAVLFFSVGATTNLDVVLSGLRSGSPFGDDAPFVLAALALLVAGAASDCTVSDVGVTGTDRAILMLAADCSSLIWLTLAGDLFWPGSLALISEHQTVTGSVGALSVGFLLWIVRCCVLCVILAAGNLVAAGPVTRIRLRGAGALLLAFFAIQVLFGSRFPIMPYRGAVHEQSTFDDNTGGGPL
ncbi:hypothetical protein [Acetobacter fallax]|uniref:Formate hydrogenlyase subunit 4 n=1 Tax=Acetobacter fallax TaxID=1737473 RepID=A0ABX0K9L9_9PROT|nr:hypothetical protein [Acetobacter fallax]NHO33079.1 hypothetical protein [Acetobacter fallax]NHO36675.1 hypothetical protein [Acetobacter fallax]